MPNDRVAPIARRQLGLVTTAQALSVVSSAELARLLRARKLEPARRGVYQVPGAPESWRQALLAACLARPGSFASFRAAATLWQVDGFDQDRLEITIPGSNRARLDDVVVHETTVFGPLHMTTIDGIPVSSTARTLCDLTAVARPWVVEKAVDECLRRKIVTLRSLRRVAAAPRAGAAFAAPSCARCSSTVGPASSPATAIRRNASQRCWSALASPRPFISTA